MALLIKKYNNSVRGVAAPLFLNMSFKGRPKFEMSFFVLSRTGTVLFPSLSPILLKVRFHHHILTTNLITNLLTKLPYKQMSHIVVLFFSQKFVANQIGLLQTH
jgi:hypothetical protein